MSGERKKPCIEPIYDEAFFAFTAQLDADELTAAPPEPADPAEVARREYEALQAELRALTAKREEINTRAQAAWVVWNDARIEAAEKAAGGSK